MANEKRLIDANALLEQMQFRREVTDSYLQTVRDCVMIGRSLVMRSPTVDAVEVIRCKDCKYYKTITCSCGCNCVHDNWYCADGERKDNERKDD